MTTRLYTTRRIAIVDAMVGVLKGINGTGDYLTNLYDNVSPRLKFWDEVEQFPALHLNAGSESREYQGGGYKDRFLNVTLRIYVKEEDAVTALADLLEDVETTLETNSRLQYTDRQGQIQHIRQITVISIDTDEGVLEPYGVAEMNVQVQY
jgi:hypothetical protein